VLHKTQVVRSVTQRLSMASPSAHKSFGMINMTYFIYLACVDCALRVGSCMMVIVCMIVPFCMSSLL
jgi:hypothetical protein